MIWVSVLGARTYYFCGDGSRAFPTLLTKSGTFERTFMWRRRIIYRTDRQVD